MTPLAPHALLWLLIGAYIAAVAYLLTRKDRS